MDIRRITEVGIAVRDLERATQLFAELFDATVGEAVEVPRYDMRFRMCRVGKVDFEVMEAIGGRGVIADFFCHRTDNFRHLFRAPGHSLQQGPLSSEGGERLDLGRGWTGWRHRNSLMWA